MRQEKLSSLLDISIGRTPSRNKAEYWGDGYPWVSIRDLNSKTVTETKEQITDIGVKDARCKLVKKGTLLFSFKLTIGKMAFAGCDLFTNEAIAAFSIKDGKKLTAEYLYYALKSVTYGGSNQAVMGKTLNLKSLAEIKIPLPSFDDQIRIAHLLGSVEGLITQRKQHLQQLDDLLKSVFFEMFGDPVRNERAWDKPELKTFGRILTGNTPPRNEPSNYDGDFIEWIKTDNIPKDAMYITHAAEHLSEKGSHKARMLEKGALLIACIAGSIESIGRAALTDRTVAFNQQINAIQPGKDVNPLYLYGLFKLSQAYIQSHAAKGMKKILTKGDFEKITLVKPPIEPQNQFASIVEKIETLKSRYQQSLDDLESLYVALSQQAFKGALDLSRVPLPDVQVNTTKADASEQVTIPETEDLPINLPDTDYLLDAQTNSSLRERLLYEWLESYCLQIGFAPFSVNDFIAAAQARIVELHPETDFELGVDDYEIIKDWVFEALKSERLAQLFDEENNQIQLIVNESQSRYGKGTAR
ncbi:restriction endonuclease subunit S [Rheinheimera pleomorphica]|uniref:restriction endonuclease subunit S n=1 Tax=Rheinheimera pleomorphica TaxID=2703963 RepID=UPI00142220A9|nr:restriction endonuclease subunit S [Rheinheimera pleomorphica]